MFEKIDIHSLNFNPFDKVGKDWLLISATKNGKTNTMTASWGTLGHLWNKDVAIIFIRPQRYTKEFVKVRCSPYPSLMINTKNYLT